MGTRLRTIRLIGPGSPAAVAAAHGSRRGAIVLWLGILALALNALMGIAHMRIAANGESVALELCTHAGVVRVELPSDAEQSGAHGDAGDMLCCDLCGARAGTLVAEVDPRPILLLALDGTEVQAPPPDAPRPHDLVSLSPLVPRAPPART